MVPRPLLLSPPAEADQVTAAVPPPVKVAENCSTALPEEFLALHPTQLVSIAAVPGAILNVLFELPFAMRPLPPQPARMNSERKAITAKSRSAADAPGRRHSSAGVLVRTRVCFETRLSSIKSSNAFKIVYRYER